MTALISSIFAIIVNISFILSLIGIFAFPSRMGIMLGMGYGNTWLAVIIMLIIDIMAFGVIYVLLDIMHSLRSIKENTAIMAGMKAMAPMNYSQVQQAPQQNITRAPAPNPAPPHRS